MRLLLSHLLISSLLFWGCTSPTSEVSGHQVKEPLVVSSKPVVSDSLSVSHGMKKDSAKIVPKTIAKKTKVNKPIQRTEQLSSNTSADYKKDVTTKYPKTVKKSKTTIPTPPQTIVKKPPTTPPVPQRKGARIYFPTKNYNYGKINEGKKINHKFKFINTGDDSLLIKNVDVSCGCTVPKYSNKKVAPGSTGYIDVEYDSKGKFMNQESSIFIYSNSRISPTVELMLTGYVRVPLARDKKKEEEKKDSTASTPEKKPEAPKTQDKPKDKPKPPVVNTDTIKKKIKDVIPKVIPKKEPEPPKDTTAKTSEVKAVDKEGEDW